MKNKLIISLIIIILTIIISPQKIYAEEQDYGEDELVEALPGEIADELNKKGITPGNNGVLGLTPNGILSYLWEEFKKEITQPLKMFFSILGIILLCALIEALRDGSVSGEAGNTFRLVGVICCSGIMATNIAECIERTTGVLNAGGVFFGVFVPVFAGIIAITGQVASATVFCGVIIVAAQIILQLILLVLIPMTGGIFGISIAGAINPDLKVENIADTVKKIVTWILGILIVMFVGLLSVQSFIAGAADSVTLRAAKFAVSNSVPIIGGAVSDALATVKSSIGLVKSGTGTFGVVAIAALLLPSIISVIMYRLAFSIASAISDMFGINALTKLLKSSESVLSMILAMITAFSALSIISIALMLLMHNGATV